MHVLIIEDDAKTADFVAGAFRQSGYVCMRNRGRVVSRNTILERVWDYDFDPHTNVVEARVCRLREKIDRNSPRKLISTVRGVGYVLG